MEEGIASAATNLGQPLVNRAINEADYLCCFENHVEGFKKEKSRLLAIRGSLLKEIEEARQRNENLIDDETQHWLKEADGFMQEDTEAKKKWFFGLCTNCIWQYKRGKELAGKTLEITELMRRRNNLVRVARSAGFAGMDHHYPQNFIKFESRKDRYEELKEALRNENIHMIGLQGMGGTGKTTMAIAIGKEVEESKLFDKVIFIVASNPPDVKKIRGVIARRLGLTLKEGKESEEHAESLWYRIANGGEKLLIILDDVWGELNLKAIGITLGRHHKGCCSVLLTARDISVCDEMGCQKMVELGVLSDEDALTLFLLHAGKSVDGSSSDVKDVALDIVKECGRLPVAIVAVARTLKNWSLVEWKAALTTLQNCAPTNVHENLKKVYKSLSLSYDKLENENAKKLFLLCSLFPKDSEIPIELLSRIVIGLGLCGEAHKYYIARSQVPAIKNKLIESCLLLKAEKECVKMHDLIHEMALWKANGEIQVVIDSNTTLKEDVRYSFWNIVDFPNRFDQSKLEILFVRINANHSVEVPDALFGGMTRLRVLLLIYWGKNWQIQAPPLLQSIQSLRSIRTLILLNWGLGDISILGNLQCLETLELNNCLIIELPNEVSELEKLRLLGLRYCKIEKNNPFEVIGRCRQLEELYYVLNWDILLGKTEGAISKIGIPPALQRYRIIGYRAFSSSEVDTSISRCFIPRYLIEIFSEATKTLLAGKAEILELGEYDETGWKNLIPDIVPYGGMKDLISLYLYDWSEIECLIHTEDLQSGVTIFSKLIELKLSNMDVKELCCGPLPIDFLKQLERLDLQGCLKLDGKLFKGKLELANLKFIELQNCSMTSLFHPSTAQSLKQLERLDIYKCDQLKYIITDEGLGKKKVDNPDPNQNSHGSMFPKLKNLIVTFCDKLEFILPISFVEGTLQLEELIVDTCEELQYIFGQYPNEGVSYLKGTEVILPSLKVMVVSEVPKFINIYPECYHPTSSITQNSTPTTREKLKLKDPSPSYFFSPICCFQPKSNTTSIDNPIVSEATQPNRNDSQGIQALNIEWVFNTAQCLLKRPLNPFNMREMEITYCSNLTSLFTLPIASSMSLLEKLEVRECHGLKHIVTDEGDGHGHMNYSSVFPNLQEVSVQNCSLLESIFPASHFRTLPHLESVEISGAHKLRYVFGRCYCEDILPPQNQNVEILLPALKHLSLHDVPNMINIVTENCHLTALSLEEIDLGECPQLPIRDFTDFKVGWHERQEDLITMRKAMEIQPEKLTHLCFRKVEIDTIYDLQGLQVERPVNSSLQNMRLENLPELRNICMGPKDILSLQNLSNLVIQECKKLKVIFCASILRCLPQLSKLVVSNCDELVQIIEETEQNPVPSHQKCFPDLISIDVSECRSLKCLFSISTCGMLPNLKELKIEDAPELVQVFGYCKQGETKELVLKDVFPKLIHLEFINLQNLENVCQGIDFQTVPDRVVHGCPKFSLPSSTTKDNDDEDSAEPYQKMVESNGNPAPEAQAESSKRRLPSLSPYF